MLLASVALAGCTDLVLPVTTGASRTNTGFVGSGARTETGNPTQTSRVTSGACEVGVVAADSTSRTEVVGLGCLQ